MCMHICMSVGKHAEVYIYLYVSRCVPRETCLIIYLCVHASMWADMHVSVWMDGWMWGDMYVCMDGWMDEYRKNCMSEHMYICMCTHIFIHTFMHTECNSWQYVFHSKNT